MDIALPLMEYLNNMCDENLSGAPVKLDSVAELVRAQASGVEGQTCTSRVSQSSDLHNLYLSLPSRTLGITKIGQGLVGSVS